MDQEIRRVGEGPVHYRRAGGGGRALVLLHGLASNGSRWSELVRTSGLAEHWTVLVPDCRGQGLSLFRGRMRSEDWLDDMAAMLDQEGFDDCVIGGHCLGANVAARFAHRWPQRARGLILVEPILVETLTSGLGMLARLRGLLGPLVAIVLAANAIGLRRRSLLPLNLEELDRMTRRKMAEGAGRRALTRRYGSPLHDLRHVPVSSYLQGLIETLRPMPPWGEIPTPTLVLLSSASRFGDLGRMRGALGALPDHVTLVLEAEHWIHAEQPEALRVHVENWLTAHELRGHGDRRGQG
jgi:pimeloyl-ACP methyl ester carboxylesterase